MDSSLDVGGDDRICRQLSRSAYSTLSRLRA